MYVRDGLSAEEVLVSRKQHGLNVLPENSIRTIDILTRQFRGVFNILLLGAAIIALALGEIIDAGFIVFFVLVGVFLGFYQEYKSNTAAQKLKKYLSRTATVLRNGVSTVIPIEEVVCGDMLVLEQGDIVPADAEVLDGVGLLVNEESFTGESVSVAKDSTGGNGVHTLLQGTSIVHGTARARVTAIGSQTRFAEIAVKANAPIEKSLLTQGVDKISTFVLRVTLVTLLFVILGNVLIHGSDANIPLLLVFAISLAVSVIPEALPLVSTFSLSRGALRLAQKKVILKRLSSVQDLGAISVLCTDKTGTITENHLTLTNQYYVDGSAFTPQLLGRLAVNDMKKRVTEPFDVAIAGALSSDDTQRFFEYTHVRGIPFDPHVRSNGAVVCNREGETLTITRGAPEHVLSLVGLQSESVDAWIKEEEAMGHRVLGLAYAYGSGSPCFGGLLSFVDMLKPSALPAIRAAREMNVLVRIITGDAQSVAEAIGREVGLVTKKEDVCTADAFFDLPFSEQIRTVDQIKVFARTSPEQKLSIIELLKARHKVGFLGEGINDAPALRAAHVSMVVQSASDIARETADIVLLDSDLGVVVEGVRLGRETHANVMKYVRATLISNFGNFYAVAISSFFVSFLPMLPKQLLLLNLLSDTPMMAIAFDRVSKNDIVRPQSYDFRSLWIIVMVLGLVSTVFDFIFFGLYYHISPEALRTNWFIGSVLTEIFLVFSVRTMLPFYKAGPPARSVILLTFFVCVSALLLPFIPITATFFGFTTPTSIDLTVIVGLCVTYLVVTEVLKVPLSRYLSHVEH